MHVSGIFNGIYGPINGSKHMALGWWKKVVVLEDSKVPGK